MQLKKLKPWLIPFSLFIFLASCSANTSPSSPDDNPTTPSILYPSSSQSSSTHSINSSTSTLVDEDMLEFRPYSFHYTDNIYLQNMAFSIQIDLHPQEENANFYQVMVSVGDSSKNPSCSFCDTVSLVDDFNPETIDIGYLISDVNSDGDDDILIDLGVASPYRFFNCYVYDSNKMNFTKVKDFSSLPDPKIISDDGIVISCWKDGPVAYGADKYHIVGSDLQLSSRLTQSYAYDNGERPRYTEEKMINGRLTIIKENVLGDEIDDLSSYHLDD